MSDQIEGALTALREAVTAGFVRSNGETAVLRGDLAALREAVTAGFVRSNGETAVLRGDTGGPA